MLYIDSPAGVGFSFSSNPLDYVTNDTKTAEDANTFLRLFLMRHNELAHNAFFVAGESYAGIYVPMLLRRLVAGNAQGELPAVNIEGYLIGNGCTDPKFDGDALVPFAHGKSLISDALYNNIQSACNGVYWNATKGSPCDHQLRIMDKALVKLNIYDTLDQCFRTQKSSGLSSTVSPKVNPLISVPLTVGRAWPLLAPVQQGIVHTWPQLTKDLTRRLRGAPPCIDDRSAAVFLNNAAVREAIHAMPSSVIGEWDLCTSKIKYTHNVASMIGIHDKLLKQGYRALIYSGDHDMCVPHTGSEAWTKAMGLPVIDAWRAWMVGDDQVAGYSVTYKSNSTANLTYATVMGAGHTVPEYKPQQSLQMFQRFLQGVPL